jgi:hypothetical protein
MKKPPQPATPAKDRKIPPVVVQNPKIRVPNAPAGKLHRDRRFEAKAVPSGRLAKHKKKSEG